MHRNLKPSNILLSKNNHVRISDFGLSKEESLEISLSKGVGTMRFMAPELFEEEEDDNDIDKKQSNIRYTNKIDVFSFGISLIYIVTEEYPQFNFNDASDSIARKLKGKVVNWVRELIHRCLSHSPDNRPFSVAICKGVIFFLHFEYFETFPLFFFFFIFIIIIKFFSLLNDDDH